jgi:nicotinamidase-related amidase
MPQPKTALLVVDAQVGVLASIWESERVVENLQRLVAKARASGVPVVWVQHSDDELKYGSEAWKLAPPFVPAAGEVVVHKKYNSSFAETDLDQRLRALEVTRVVLGGAATNWCIRATAYAAVERGYDLTLIGDAHSTEPIKLADGRSVAAEWIVTDLNTVFQWLSVPKVRTEVKKTADVAF